MLGRWSGRVAGEPAAHGLAPFLLAGLAMAASGGTLQGEGLATFESFPSSGNRHGHAPRTACEGDELRAESGPIEAGAASEVCRIAWLPRSGGRAQGRAIIGGLVPGEPFSLVWEPCIGPEVALIRTRADCMGAACVPLADLHGALSVVRSQGGTGARLALPPRVAPGSSGEILVSELMRDPQAVPDAMGEWLEVFNTTNQPIDLEGWSLSDEGSDWTILDNAGAGIVVPPRGYLVLGRELSPTFNGGATVDAEYQGVVLANGADEVLLRRPGGRLVDRVAYDAAWPTSAGASIELSEGRLGAAWNDDPAHWCLGTSALTAGDLGSPGASNGACP